jgi:hypothetical protein
MAPVRLLDTPGYYVLNEDRLGKALPYEYQDLKARGFDFTLESPSGNPIVNQIKDITEKNRGGASEFRPLTYQEFDKNIEELYPIGSVYMNATDSKNPKLLLGFGDWQRLSSGNTLLGIDEENTSAASVDLRNKILSAEKDGTRVTLKLQPKAEAIEELTKIYQPNLPSGFPQRQFNYYVGLRINVQGLKKPDGSAGPSGNFTITSVDSDKAQYDSLAPAGTEDLDKGAKDQNIIRFSFNDNSFNGLYDVGGGEDANLDNAYVTVLTKKTMMSAANVNGVEYTGGDKDVAIELTQFPPHAHKVKASDLNLKQKDGFGGSAGTNDYHDRWGPNWLSGNYNAWDTGGSNYATERVPSGTSRNDENVYAADISNAGSGSTFSHNNMQPYVAVHMWKRVG